MYCTLAQPHSVHLGRCDTSQDCVPPSSIHASWSPQLLRGLLTEFSSNPISLTSHGLIVFTQSQERGKRSPITVNAIPDAVLFGQVSRSPIQRPLQYHLQRSSSLPMTTSRALLFNATVCSKALSFAMAAIRLGSMVSTLSLSLTRTFWPL